MDDKTLRKILKEELKGFATKADLKSFATKGDLGGVEKKLSKKIEKEVRNSELRVTKVIMREVGDLSLLISASFKELDEKADKSTTVNPKTQN